MAVENGRIVVFTKSSGLLSRARQPAVLTWIEENQRILELELMSVLETQILKFDEFTTGQYGAHKASGVTLQFDVVGTELRAHTIFNVDVRYTRQSKHHAPGDRLPGKQFRPLPRSKFRSFWTRTGLPEPNRAANFYKKMHLLKQIIFTGELLEREKLDKQTIEPLNVSKEQIGLAINQQTGDIIETKRGQDRDKRGTKLGNKDFAPELIKPHSQQDSATGAVRYGTRQQGSTCKGDPTISISHAVKEQPIDEWLTAYSKKH